MRTTELAAALNTPKRKGGRLTAGEVSLILTMAAENKTIDQIAVALGAVPNTVRACLARFTDTSQQALAKLRHGAEQAADHWMAAQKPAARLGNHKPARDHLAAIGVVRDTPVIGTQVVVVGMGAAAIGEDPWAESPAPVPVGTLRLPSKDQGPDDVIMDLLDPEPGA